MKHLVTFVLLLVVTFGFSQEEKLAMAAKKANDLVYEANELASNDEFVTAEMEYRKALSEKSTSIAGNYNLGHSYYKNGNYEEALLRNERTIKNATDKGQKHKAFHNIGNILMKNKKCKEAVDAFKNALRNTPQDDESRYNLGLAKECAKKQEEEQQEQDKKDDKKDDKEKDEEKEEQEKKEDEGKDKEEEKDKGDKDKKDGEDQKDEEGKPKDEKEDEGKGDQEKEDQKKQQQPGKMSPQQIKTLLEAMDNQAQKVREKMNAEKTKGVKVQTEKDW